MVSPCPRPRCSRDIGQAPASLSSRTHANRKRKCTSFPGNDKSLGLASPWGRSVPCDCGQQDGMYVRSAYTWPTQSLASKTRQRGAAGPHFPRPRRRCGGRGSTGPVCCLWLLHRVCGLVASPSEADRPSLRLADVPFVFQRRVNH